MVPPNLRPKPVDYAFDLDRALTSVVGVRADVPDDAFTAGALGVKRRGHGVVFGERGLVLTIGYLVLEAETVWLRTHDGRNVQGHPLAFDQETGFGLVQPLAPLHLPALPLGDSSQLAVGARVIVAGLGGKDNAVAGQVLARQEFAGYWEYALDAAMFIMPAHPDWGGAAVIDENGALAGIASLQIEHGGEETRDNINLAVPVDILKPRLDDLVRYGRVQAPARPWLGIYVAEVGDRLVVAGLAERGPASGADIESGDLLIAVNGERPRNLAEAWRKIWALGPAGVVAPLLIERDGRIFEVKIKSADRLQFMRAPLLH
ncbi:MAG: serine protease [Hyphomicrobiales bacterium]|nr:serine protease [Hyphomicrobiales bacterium]